MTLKKEWASVCKKVKKFADRNKNARILCLALINNTYCFEGDETLKSQFATDPDVFTKFKEAIHALPSTSEPVAERENTSLCEMLEKDISAMDVHEMRAIITAACGPVAAKSTREDRKNWFKPENAPQWWKDTGLPFVSVNHPKGHRKFGRAELSRLINSCQQYFCASTPAGHTTPDPVANPTNTVDSVAPTVQDYYSIMKLIGTCDDWQEFCCLCDDVQASLPKLPSLLCNSWTVPTLLQSNPLYKNHIPATVGKRICLASKADGNCVFNSISTCLYGNEDNAKLVRLSSAVHMADCVMDYSKYIMEEFQDNTQAWVASVCKNLPSGNFCQLECIEKICREELLETVRNPYRDCSIFHLHMVANLLKRPITNHFGGTRHDFLVGQYLFPPLSDVLYPEAIHLAWVPTKPSRYASVNHVVPAVCPLGPYGTHLDECAFEGIQCCIFLNDAHPHVRPMWIECSKCGQWLHDVCIKMDASNVTEEDVFHCGCHRIVDRRLKLKKILFKMTLHPYGDMSTRMQDGRNSRKYLQLGNLDHLRMI